MNQYLIAVIFAVKLANFMIIRDDKTQLGALLAEYFQAHGLLTNHLQKLFGNSERRFGCLVVKTTNK
ncbi:hypothetical protein [Lactococcus cremoris]|uniref:hypothetical protein n=1 Tax=Lactococcus lactis subsp. cremoris TaxID=1359 RepID=UPI00292D4F2F|nr:hypothetical protein [Lactococcus cremoris]